MPPPQPQNNYWQNQYYQQPPQQQSQPNMNEYGQNYYNQPVPDQQSSNYGCYSQPNETQPMNSSTEMIKEEDIKEEKKAEIVDLDTKEIKLAPLIKEEEIKTEIETKPDTKLLDSKTEELLKIEEEFKLLDELKKEKDSSKAKDDGIPYDWAVELMKGYLPDLIENSPKMEVFFCILEESIKLGDRILLFSQSLLTLNLIEKFLQKSKIYGTENYWTKNLNYFRKYCF